MTNWWLLNYAEYERVDVIKRFLFTLYQIKDLAWHGDSVAQSILIDIVDAFNGVRFTRTQMKYMRLHIVGYNQEEITIILSRNKSNVSRGIKSSCEKISKYLEEKRN